VLISKPSNTPTEVASKSRAMINGKLEVGPAPGVACTSDLCYGGPITAIDQAPAIIIQRRHIVVRQHDVPVRHLGRFDYMGVSGTQVIK
jgi:hypothetical protein